MGVATSGRVPGRVEAPLVLLDVELPVGVQVAREVTARRRSRASAVSGVQRMPERSNRSRMRFLQAPSTEPEAIGQPLAR